MYCLLWSIHSQYDIFIKKNVSIFAEIQTIVLNIDLFIIK